MLESPIIGGIELVSAMAATRGRLLQAAGEVFAEQGYRGATVRDICRRAGANVAAINYHFGDKQNLYHAVLAFGLKAALEKYPPDMGLPAEATAEDRLKAYIRSLLHRMLGEGAPAWHGKLMSREMIDPTGALDTVVQETILPLSQHLGEIIRDLLGKAADREPMILQRCVFSIVGQCLFYHQAAPVIAKLEGPPPGGSGARIAQLAEHVFVFSLAALKCISSQAREAHAG